MFLSLVKITPMTLLEDDELREDKMNESTLTSPEFLYSSS